LGGGGGTVVVFLQFCKKTLIIFHKVCTFLLQQNDVIAINTLAKRSLTLECSFSHSNHLHIVRLNLFHKIRRKYKEIDINVINIISQVLQGK